MAASPGINQTVAGRGYPLAQVFQGRNQPGLQRQSCSTALQSLEQTLKLRTRSPLSALLWRVAVQSDRPLGSRYQRLAPAWLVHPGGAVSQPRHEAGAPVGVCGRGVPGGSNAVGPPSSQFAFGPVRTPHFAALWGVLLCCRPSPGAAGPCLPGGATGPRRLEPRRSWLRHGWLSLRVVFQFSVGLTNSRFGAEEALRGRMR